ncbi:hypothetical protein P3L10_017945 [Capsicum annuum]
MMNNPTFSLVILFLLLIFTCLCEITTKADNADAKFYVVYLGHKPHNNYELITNSHHELLGQVAGSKEEAKKLMMYSYRHGFSGFAAKLTDSQAKQIGVIPNQFYKTHTSRSWDFLGLSKHDPNSLVNKTNQGDGIIIGIIDSGLVAWNGINGEMISNIDVLAAIDDAIKDGVDVISISIGGGGGGAVNYADINEDTLFGIGSFHAVSYGRSFIASGGNSGPTSYTVGATSPWVISVASSCFNREIVTPLTLGNNKTIRASGLIKGKGHGFAPLVTLANVTKV